MAFEGLKEYGPEKLAWVGLRLGLGWTTLWAFLDKTFGLGYATTRESSWLEGGSPTTGYLSYATSGPFADVFKDIAGNTVVDVLFMLALLMIGVALILGIGVRIAGYAGALLMVLLWSTNLPPANNPLIDEHIIYMIVFLGMTVVRPGKWIGLGRWWAQTGLVKRFPILE